MALETTKIKKFTGLKSDFENWKNDIISVLIEKDLVWTININTGTLKKDALPKEKREDGNLKLYGLVFKHIDENVKDILKPKTKAGLDGFTAWSELIKKYDTSSVYEVFAAYRELSHLIWDGTDIEKHILTVRELARKSNSGKNQLLNAETKKAVLYSTLPEHYMGYIERTATDPEYTFEKICDDLIDIEKARSSIYHKDSSSHSKDSSALFTGHQQRHEGQSHRGGPPHRGNFRGQRGQGHRGHRGQARGSQRGGNRGQNNGNPNANQRPQNQQQQNNNTCQVCGLPGHREDNCRIVKGLAYLEKKKNYSNSTEDNGEGQGNLNMLTTFGEVYGVETSTTDFIIDSGATSHMTGDENLFTNIEYLSARHSVYTAGKEQLTIKGLGTINFQTHDDGNHIRTITLHEVLLVAGLRRNLLCTYDIESYGNKVQTYKKRIKMENGTILPLICRNKLFFLPVLSRKQPTLIENNIPDSSNLVGHAGERSPILVAQKPDPRKHPYQEKIRKVRKLNFNVRKTNQRKILDMWDTLTKITREIPQKIKKKMTPEIPPTVVSKSCTKHTKWN
jgi:hypothetical protein